MNFNLKHTLFILLIIVLSNKSFAQFDTLNTVFKPRIGVGTGVLTYYGEVQNYQIGFSPLVGRYAGSIFIDAPLNKYFKLEFSTMYGKVSANERTLTRNLNFQSRIRTNSLMVYYNFYPILSGANNSFTPLLGVGFTSLEFLSKTDLYDANGNMYYYWSDGSIMNLPENDPNAANAVPIKRDYTYETDLRELNYDGLGKYREQTFAIPITMGGEWHIAKRFDFRVSATLNYSFTDLIDNISPAGEGVRKGDNKKDYLLYSSASLSYDLEFKRKNKVNNSENDGPIELAEFEIVDTDQDGVIDALDNCVRTPIEAIVDENGCPIDSDKDGVPDYYDEEPDTPIGNFVDQYGVTVDEEAWLRQMALFNDSTGLLHEFKEEYTKVDWRNKDGQIVKTKNDEYIPKNYVIIIGKDHKSVTSNELHEYLAWNEFKTIIKGDTAYYVLGEYSTIEEAVAAKTGLEKEGVDVDIIGRETHDNKKYIPIKDEVIEKVEKINEENGTEPISFEDSKPVYRVQIGAFKSAINTEELFPDLDVLAFAKGKDGITRYYTGNFDTYEAAEAERQRLVKMGYKTAFVTVYKNHNRVTLKEAGVDNLPKTYSEDKEKETFVEGEGENQSDNNTNQNTTESKIDMSKVKYSVLLGSFEGEVPVENIKIYLEIGGVKPVKDENGVTHYYSRIVDSKDEAEQLLNDYKKYDFSDMKIVYFYDNKYYTEEEFQQLNK